MVFRVSVVCESIEPESWPDAPSDVAEEFAARDWQKIIDCRWDGSTLVLVAENDYDHNGEALADEFSDTVAAYAPGASGYGIRVLAAATVQ